jgi:uncharacterized protein
VGEQDFSLEKPCRVRLELQRRGREIHAQGQILTALTVLCDRCLSPIIVPIDSKFNLIYLSLDHLTGSDKVILARQDLDFSFYSNDRLDLDELVQEQLRLELPMSNLCRADCLGLCQRCGQNLNIAPCQCETEEIDPRWQALRELKHK